jgi:hypothetical protein
MKLHIATPMYGGNCTAGYTSSVINLSRILPFEHNFVTNESLVTRARNMLAHVFLASDCTHLLFIDADVAFDAQGILQMVESGKDVIGGLYAKKHIDWNRAHAAAMQGASPHQMAASALTYYVRGKADLNSIAPVEVDSIGTGLMLIKRDVFEAMKPHTHESMLGSDLVGQTRGSRPRNHGGAGVPRLGEQT